MTDVYPSIPDWDRYVGDLVSGSVRSGVGYDFLLDKLAPLAQTELDIESVARQLAEPQYGELWLLRRLAARYGIAPGGMGLAELRLLVLGARAALGSDLHDPFMVMGFMALEVIPTLRLTDQGLVDVEQFKPVPLFVEEMS